MKLSLVAPLDNTSFGLHARQLMRWLPQMGIELTVRPTKPVAGTQPDGLIQNGPNDCPVELILGHPTIAPQAGKITVGLFAWESTRLPAKMVNICNKCAAIIVPSNYCATVFSASGVNVPIHVVPLGVSEAFKYQPPQKNGGFTFACAGNLANGARRKGIQNVVDCFCKTFPPESNVVLSVKLGPTDSLITYIDPRIQIERRWMEEKELIDWMAQADCFVHLGTGAFELQVLEFMAIGRQVVAMNFGGHADYFRGITVAHHLTRADGMWVEGLFAEPNEESIIVRMREAAGSPAYGHMNARENIASIRHLTWANHAQAIAAILEPLFPKAATITSTSEESDELTVCITNFGRAKYLNRAIKSCVEAGIDHVVVASMEPDEEVCEVMSEWMDREGDWITWTHLPVDIGCHELWLQAAYRSRTERLIILHDDDYLAPEFGSCYRNELSPALRSGIVTWLGKNIWDNGRTAEARYFGNSASGEYDIQQFREILLDPVRLSLSPIVTIFRKTALIAALKECAKHLTKPESFLHPEMQLGTEIVAHFRNSHSVKRWHYFNEVLSFYGTHAKSGTVLTSKPILLSGYNVARGYCRKHPTPQRGDPRIIFVFNEYHASGEEKRRNDYAMKTWEPHFNTGDMLRVGVWDNELDRSSSQLGDTKPVPFLKDVIAQGVSMAQEDDVIVYANRDICLTTEAPTRIHAGVKRGNGVSLAVRRNIFRPVRNKLYRSVLHCPSDAGFDLFAFTPKWWLEHKDLIPDMLIGREVWDACFRRVAQESNGESIFMDDVTYHEFHESFWIKERVTNAGQLYNRELGRKFFAPRAARAGDSWMETSARHIMGLLDDDAWKK